MSNRHKIIFQQEKKSFTVNEKRKAKVFSAELKFYGHNRNVHKLSSGVASSRFQFLTFFLDLIVEWKLNQLAHAV